MISLRRSGSWSWSARCSSKDQTVMAISVFCPFRSCTRGSARGTASQEGAGVGPADAIAVGVSLPLAPAQETSEARGAASCRPFRADRGPPGRSTSLPGAGYVPHTLDARQSRGVSHDGPALASALQVGEDY